MELCEQIYLNKVAAKNKTYNHHPRRFIFNNGERYTPDFFCIEDNEYIEVAGTRQAYHANKHKYALMKKEYPLIKFSIVHLWKKTDPDVVTKAKIAKSLNVSKTLVSSLSNNKRKTTNIPLAIAVAKLTGKAPVYYLSAKIKALALQINPALNRKIK